MLGIFAILTENPATNSNTFILKTKTFLAKFYSIFRIYIKITTFSKNSWASYLNYFRNYSFRKAWILECIGELVSEHPQAVNVLMCPKHCTSMAERTFAQFFHQPNFDNGGKRAFESDFKSQNCIWNYSFWMLVIFTIVTENTTTNSNAFTLKPKPF